MASLSSLRSLRVSNNSLTALPEEALASLPRLREVHAEGNVGLGAATVEALRRQRPEIKVIWDGEELATSSLS